MNIIYFPSCRTSSYDKKEIPLIDRNIDLADEFLLSEEISHFRKMNASEVKQELINLGLTTEPSDDFSHSLKELNQTTSSIICPKDEVGIEINTIEKWLGSNSYPDYLPAIKKEILFEQVERTYRSIFHYYNLTPSLTSIADLIHGKPKNIDKEFTSDNFQKTCVDYIVNRSLKKLIKLYPCEKSITENFLIPWLTEIARIPMRREIISIIPHIISSRKKKSRVRNIENVKPESILYMILLFLSSQNIKVLYCNYLQDNIFKKLQIYFSNGEGKNYHDYKQEIANECLKILMTEEYINKAFLVNISEATVILPFTLFCIRTKDKQIILIGISKKDADKNINILVEAITLSGFIITRDAIWLKQKNISQGIKFDNLGILNSERIQDINHIETNYIDMIISKSKEPEKIIDNSEIIENISDVVNEMSVTYH